MIKDRILYFAYVVLTSFKHRKKIKTFSRYYGKRYDKSSAFFLSKAYVYFLKHDMHPLDYFYYDIYNNKNFNAKEHANTLYMYRYHKLMNDKDIIKFFHNKILFHKKFESLMGHSFIALKNTDLTTLNNWFLSHKSDRFMIKNMKSVGGFGVKKLHVRYEGDEVYVNDKLLKDNFNYLKKFDLIEEFVEQHEVINKINSSCLNTIRVVTVIDKNSDVHIVGAVIRFGVNNDVDNFHSGGIAVNIDVNTGRLSGNGFRLDPSEESNFTCHPISKIHFDNYQLPNWDILTDMIQKAAKVIPQARTIGWDVAITSNNVSLIEGNHDWDKIIIEKALHRGIRKQLEQYI